MRPLTTLGDGMVTAVLLLACQSDGDELSDREFSRPGQARSRLVAI